MTTRSRALGWAGWVVAGTVAWGLGEPRAHAAETCDGRVCPEGFTCTTATATCAPGDSNCEPFTETYCQSPACEKDSDCPAGRRCRVRTLDCTTPPPSGGGGGTGTPAEPCEPRTDSWCHLSYDLPCETDAQCGTGFTCQSLVACDCSNPDAPVPPDCSCELADQKGCYTPVVACSSAADCPAGWRCVDNEHGLCNVVGDLHTGCRPGDPPLVCIPPGFDSVTTTVDSPEGTGDTGGKDPGEGGNASGSGGCAVGGNAGSGVSALVLALSLGLRSVRRRRRT